MPALQQGAPSALLAPVRQGPTPLYPCSVLWRRVAPRLPAAPVNAPCQPRFRSAVVPLSASSGKTPPPATTVYTPNSAKDAVERGLEVFESGDVAGALALFEAALRLRPNDDEARAALYNSACCHTKLKQWQQAADAVVSAVNDYELKLVVALQDPDLEPLRQRREWLDALAEVVGGVKESSYTQLRAEAKAPFRLVRLLLFGATLAGAGVGMLILLIRTAAALKGGDGAPDVAETLQNAGINAAVVAVFATLVYRDLQAQKRDAVVVEREEGLARLQVAVSAEKQLPLASFRGVVRPVLLAGSRGYTSRCIRAAEPLYEQLRERGVSLVPLETNADDPGDKLRKLKKEFSSASSSGGGKGFTGESKREDKPRPEAASKKDQKWQLTAYAVDEWLQWVAQQKAAAGVEGDGVWVQVQLDGTVRSSGVGIPPWSKLVSELPPLDDVRTKWTDGIGRT